MAHLRSLLVLCLIFCFYVPAVCPQDKPAAGLSVGGEVERPLKLSAADLARLPRRTVRAKDHSGKEAEFEGVALIDLPSQAGVKFGDQMRGASLAKFLVVEAADGYKAVFALPELDPAFTDRVILLADKRDGKSLAESEGPFRVIVPGEKRQARWVRQVVALNIRHA
jgi:DMSO/TMAO reductase YedYZ molybdopterin-dependent catalytic subunit